MAASDEQLFEYFNGEATVVGPFPRGGAYMKVPTECGKHCDFFLGNKRTYAGEFEGEYYVWNCYPSSTHHICRFYVHNHT